MESFFIRVDHIVNKPTNQLCYAREPNQFIYRSRVQHQNGYELVK